MEYEYEVINDKYSSSTSSASSSTSDCFLPATNKHTMNNNSANNQMFGLLGSHTISDSSDTVNTPANNNNTAQNFYNVNTNIPNSCSLIFSTAASFNINQNDVVFYSRETIHLLAKFLANNSEITLFRSLYSYAPDNLALLWAFIDWTTPIDMSQVPVQEKYQPFEWCLDDSGRSPADDDLIAKINKIFADSPLVQYKYREPLMIADLYKFLEHVQKINLKYVAISLFAMYFPRFAIFLEDKLKIILRPKILAANLPIINGLDAMIVRLIKTRYSNLYEYKQKILSGSNQIPTYVHTIINDSSFWKNPINAPLAQSLLKSQKTQNDAQQNELANSHSNKSSSSSLNSMRIQTPTNFKFPHLNDISIQTLSYLKLLQNSTRINNDLDHIDDEVNNSNLDTPPPPPPSLHLQPEEESFGSRSPNRQEVLSPSQHLNDQSYLYMNLYNGLDEKAELLNTLNNYRLSQQQQQSQSGCMSPQSSFSPYLNQSAAQRILINTPQTPSNLSPYSLDKHQQNVLDSSSLWPTSQAQPRQFNNRYMSSSSVTPPPSATIQASNLSLFVDPNQANEEQLSLMSPLVNSANHSQFEPLLLTPSLNEDQFAKYFKNSAYISSPLPRHQKFSDYTNFVGSNLSGNNMSSNSGGVSNGILVGGNLSSQAQSVKNMAASNNVYDLNIKINQTTPNSSSGNFLQSTKSPQYTSARSPVYSMGSSSSIQHVWCGRLPPKIYSPQSLFSRKVFLGGLPWDVNQQNLLQLLHKYGSVKLEIPGKDLKHPRVSNINKLQERSTPGYVYIIFDNESAVQRMLADCRKEIKNGGEHYYYRIITMETQGFTNSPTNFIKRGKPKEVEVIPWNQDDTSFVPVKLKDLPPKIDPKATIFVGALHGMLNAQGLRKVMAEIFGEVIHAGLDTDKYKYPIGSGRVTFRDRQSYVKAIKAKFVTIKANLDQSDPSPKFEKTIQIDPYLEDAKCSKCDTKSYYFCRNECCLDYYCINCWSFRHDMNIGEHLPLSRQNKSNQP